MPMSPRERSRPLVQRGRLAAALFAFSAPASAVVPSHDIGVAYEAEGDRVSYREEHWLFDEGAVRRRLVLYRCPGGAPFARKELRFDGAPWAPGLAFEDARDGYRHSVSMTGTRLRVAVRRGSVEEDRTVLLDATPDTVVDAGFDDYIREHWDAVNRAEGVRVRFVMADRQKAFDVSVKPSGPASPGDRVRHFRLRLDGWLGLVAPAIELSYTVADRRLSEFAGISDIRDERGRSQKVRIRFEAPNRLPADFRDEIARVRSLPLASSCDGGTRRP
ncbi:hypothetical protein SAMN02800694_3012 [Luteibacter sp. UNCMF331Sha3.1]|nr:hypothetical protein SAMN02800694_3012 [Luteibacter sp. UNCMF331Sha3.1]